MKFKSFDSLEEMLRNVNNTEKKNPLGINHANLLIKAGKVNKASVWEDLTAEKENSYIEASGIKEYGKWFLGTDSSVNSSNKNYFTHAYTSDFKNVDRAGLIEIKKRAEQQRIRSIVVAVSKMLDQIDSK